ncbi:Peroxisomal membrane (Mpv17/PMP22) family protein, partial [Thalictrum thalictroides]
MSLRNSVAITSTSIRTPTPSKRLLQQCNVFSVIAESGNVICKVSWASSNIWTIRLNIALYATSSPLLRIIFHQIVVLNQVVLGPCVIGVVFARNNLWKGKLAQLPAMYQNDALPRLLYGLQFWVPASILNF